MSKDSFPFAFEIQFFCWTLVIVRIRKRSALWAEAWVEKQRLKSVPNVHWKYIRRVVNNTEREKIVHLNSINVYVRQDLIFAFSMRTNKCLASILWQGYPNSYLFSLQSEWGLLVVVVLHNIYFIRQLYKVSLRVSLFFEWWFAVAFIQFLCFVFMLPSLQRQSLCLFYVNSLGWVWIIYFEMLVIRRQGDPNNKLITCLLIFDY